MVNGDIQVSTGIELLSTQPRRISCDERRGDDLCGEELRGDKRLVALTSKQETYDRARAMAAGKMG
jgi:hypothetical protein